MKALNCIDSQSEWGCTYRLDTVTLASSQQGGKHAVKAGVSLVSRCIYYDFGIYTRRLSGCSVVGCNSKVIGYIQVMEGCS
jgi:hypothetical protein